MGATTYWSVEECGWVAWAGSDSEPAEVTVPQQRVEEVASERADEPAGS